MKNKKIRYTLVILTFIVWSLIIYRVIDYRKVTIVDRVDTEQKKRKKENEFYKYSYVLNYRDPFLGTTVKEVQRRTKYPRKAKPIDVESKVTVEEAIVVLPQVSYKGLIKNSNKTIAMLVIDNKNVLVKENGEYKNMVFSDFSKDSISIKYSGKLFKVKKQY